MLVLEITTGFRAGLEVDEILDTLFDQFQQILPYDRMEYAVIAEDGCVLTTAWTRANYDSTSVPVGHAYRRSVQVSNSPRYRVPFLDNNLPEYAKKRPASHPVNLLVNEGIRCSLNCPLIVGDEVKGYEPAEQCMSLISTTSHHHSLCPRLRHSSRRVTYRGPCDWRAWPPI